MAVFLITLFILIMVIIIANSNNKPRNQINDRKHNQPDRIPHTNINPTSSIDYKKIEVEHIILPPARKSGKYIIIDIETTGLPNSKYNLIEETSKWPFILQIAWTILDENLLILKECNYYLDYKGDIPYSATAINHIDKSLIREKGVDTVSVLREFVNDALGIDYIVAHNVEFDLPIIRVELYRNKFGKPLEKIKTICTMKTSMYFVEAKNKSGALKYPRLEELYQKCFKNNDFSSAITGLHDASIDVSLTTKSFTYLIQKSILTPDGETINFDIELRKRVNSLRLNPPELLIMPLPYSRIIEKIHEDYEVDGIKYSSDISQTYFTPERKHADLYIEEGVNFEKQNNLAEAITSYNDAINTGDAPLLAFERLCIIYRKLKLYNEEINIINKCLDHFESKRNNDFRLDKMYLRLEISVSKENKSLK